MTKLTNSLIKINGTATVVVSGDFDTMEGGIEFNKYMISEGYAEYAYIQGSRVEDRHQKKISAAFYVRANEQPNKQEMLDNIIAKM